MFIVFSDAIVAATTVLFHEVSILECYLLSLFARGLQSVISTGHPQQEHETSHGSMSKTRWAIDGPEEATLEVNGRKFASNDDGAPMLCSLVCKGNHTLLVSFAL